jgi:hypothetical protein
MQLRNKRILIGVGVLVLILMVPGVYIFKLFLKERARTLANRREGTEFGKSTDNVGCQHESLRKLRTRSDKVGLNSFLLACLYSSKATPNFCDGLPTMYEDVRHTGKGNWTEGECFRNGFGGTWDERNVECVSVLWARIRYCEGISHQ